MWARSATFVLVLLAAACGGRGTPAPEVPPALTGACTGSAPTHATLCAGADVGLTSDTPRAVADACGAPCAYRCDAGYAPEAGACATAAPPSVRFEDAGDGTVLVTDSYGTTRWLADAGCNEAAGGVALTGGTASWAVAQDWAGGLRDGLCGLRDGSSPGDWQVPTQRLLLHLAEDLTEANPFVHVQGGWTWSSWNGDWGGDFQGEVAFAVDLGSGLLQVQPQQSPFRIWPVRASIDTAPR